MFDLSLIGTEHRVAITLIEDNISFLFFLVQNVPNKDY